MPTFKEIIEQNKQLPHAIDAQSVLRAFHASETGISLEEAKRRSALFGSNSLPKDESVSLWMILVDQFKSALVGLLVVASVISAFLGDWVDAVVILLVVLINAGVGFAQQYKAKSAIEALSRMSTPQTKVYRDGTLHYESSESLVPGDVVLVEQGDRVPADGRIIWQQSLRIDESSLTGESYPAEKSTEVLPRETLLADQNNMARMGTFVVGGKGHILVTGIGVRTVLGEIAKSVSASAVPQGHFEKKLNVLAWQMGALAIFGSLLTFVIGYVWRGMEFTDILLVTIATLVSAIPEGLPAVLAIVLAISATRMARKKAIVRTLFAVETLGVVDTIVTDKTGTLTENKMTVRVFSAGDRVVQVEGDGWDLSGRFLEDGVQIVPTEDADIRRFLHMAGWGNSAHLVEREGHVGEYELMGDPTEGALLVLAQKAGLSREVLEAGARQVEDVPFNGSLRYRSTLVETPNGVRERYFIGAPEVILGLSKYELHRDALRHLSQEQRNKITQTIESWSDQAMRVLAIAYRVEDKAQAVDDATSGELVFVGLAGIIDPPRKEARESVLIAKDAGVRVIMATGDHKKTGMAIASQVGIWKEGEDSFVFDEKQLVQLSEQEFREAVAKAHVLARLSPEMKKRVVKTLQMQGGTVAVTGDGTNDAPALRSADVGVAMGKNGTDVARESSEMILADDNFATIVRAVEEGRVVFDNVTRSTSYLVTTNFAETLTIIIALFLGWALPILPTQILWLNLVTESFPNMALVAEPNHGRVLKRPPYDRNKNLLSMSLAPFFAITAGTMVVLSLAVFAWFSSEGVAKAQTATFTVLAWTQLFNMFNVRSLKYSIFTIGLFSNRWAWRMFFFSVGLLVLALYHPTLQNAFSFDPITWQEFLVLAGLSSLVLWVGEGYKYVRLKTRKRNKNTHSQ